jgi:integrase
LLRNCLRTAAHSTPPLIPSSSIPQFPISNEDACARQGLLEDEAFGRLLAELPQYLVPISAVGYNTGIRKGELLKFQSEQVDFQAKIIRLYRGETRTGDPRTVPMIGDMYTVLLQAKANMEEFWLGCQWVFSRLGK